MSIRNRRGPRHKPCGTPTSVWSVSESIPQHDKIVFCLKDMIQTMLVPSCECFSALFFCRGSHGQLYQKPFLGR